jgi:hypothetical protein
MGDLSSSMLREDSDMLAPSYACKWPGFVSTRNEADGLFHMLPALGNSIMSAKDP